MKLKPDISIIHFFKTVRQCEGDVFFTTKDGDTLNLKSQLAKYVFLALVSSKNLSLIYNGELFCDLPSDYERLSEYLLSSLK